MNNKENAERRPKRKPIEIVLQNPTKIEAIYLYLYDEGIPFTLGGDGTKLQLIYLPSFEDYHKLATADGGWFEALSLDNFPEVPRLRYFNDLPHPSWTRGGKPEPLPPQLKRLPRK